MRLITGRPKNLEFDNLGKKKPGKTWNLRDFEKTWNFEQFFYV